MKAARILPIRPHATPCNAPTLTRQRWISSSSPPLRQNTSFPATPVSCKPASAARPLPPLTCRPPVPVSSSRWRPPIISFAQAAVNGRWLLVQNCSATSWTGATAARPFFLATVPVRSFLKQQTNLASTARCCTAMAVTKTCSWCRVVAVLPQTRWATACRLSTWKGAKSSKSRYAPFRPRYRIA